MQQDIRYKLRVNELPPDVPYKGRCFGLRFMPTGPGEVSVRSSGIHTILSLEPGTSALIWPTPVTIDDLRSERLLEPLALLGSPPADAARLYIVDAALSPRSVTA